MKIYISNAFDGCDSKRVESKLEICFSNTGNCIRLINRFIKNDLFKRGISYYYIVLLYLIVITIVINFVLNCRMWRQNAFFLQYLSSIAFCNNPPQITKILRKTPFHQGPNVMESRRNLSNIKNQYQQGP